MKSGNPNQTCLTVKSGQWRHSSQVSEARQICPLESRCADSFLEILILLGLTECDWVWLNRLTEKQAMMGLEPDLTSGPL